MKFNFYSYYPQYNHLAAPKYFDWVTDGSGSINVFNDDAIKNHLEVNNGKPHMAMVIEPRTIQPTIYEFVEQHYNEFKYIFTHDEELLKLPNAKPIVFMNWYKTYDVTKTKDISMVCSDKAMCFEHKERQRITDALGNLVDHYGTYKGGRYCDYYECRADYMFEICIDNNWSGYWVSEKLANPLASKTIPIYLGSPHLDELGFDMNGIITVKSPDEIIDVVKNLDIKKEYKKRIKAVNKNYKLIQEYRVFEDWWFSKYKNILE